MRVVADAEFERRKPSAEFCLSLSLSLPLERSSLISHVASSLLYIIQQIVYLRDQ